MLAIGLMSGTSLDGIDASLIRTDGETVLEIIANYYMPYEKEFQARMKRLLDNPASNEWFEAERKLTELHAQAVNNLLCQEPNYRGRVDIVGFHGQTLFHDPARKFTWQLGDANLLARLIQINVVADFRRRDVAYGGQGAPLVPIYHQAFTSGIEKPCLVVNIGGVANFTYISETDEDLLAFDVGPGNSLIDDLCTKLLGIQFDKNGEIAASGNINHRIVDEFLQEDEFFSQPPPKSLDRNHFSRFLDNGKLDTLECVTDKIATISYLTVAAIIKSIREHLPRNGSDLKRVLVCGGGAKNKFLMNSIINQLPKGVICSSVNEIGLNSDFIESQAFAYLAVRFMQKLPATYPGTTGVCQPVTGGAFFPFK